jgi:hypothetical protein
MNDLAIKVSQQTDMPMFNRRHVEKWESGRAPLPEDLLARIGTALGAEISMLNSPPEIVLPLRSRLVAFSTDGAVTRFENQMGKSAMLRAVRDRLAQLASSRGFQQFVPPIVFKSSTIQDQTVIEAMATKLRRRWDLGISPIADVVQTLEERQVTMLVEPNAQQARLFAGAIGGWPVVYWCGPTPVTDPERQDFRLRVMSAALRTMALMRGLPADDARENSSRVARAVLLPAERIGFHFGGRISVTAENVLALAYRYGLPAEETVLRMVETGAVPAHVGELLMRSLGGAEFDYCREQPLGAAILPPPM